jgi:glycine cleavage system aminomethyltransferase T
MRHSSLENRLNQTSSAAAMLRHSQIGPYAFPVVRAEFTNWRDEQRSWRDGCALFDQSHHMTDLYVEGPDALRVLSSLGVNSFRTFAVNQAKQFVACNPDGYVIGDAILFYLDRDRFSLVGRPPVANWVQYHVETGGYDATAERDERSAVNQGRRRLYRYQVQGPNAQAVMEQATGAPVPDIRFFHMGSLSIGGHEVRALRHGMVGQPGWEIFGPWEEGEAVRQVILDAGRDLGIRQVGARTYPTSCLESGWIPSPLPAIYTGAALQAYREWLGSGSYEATASLGGSFESDDVADYYLTPWDLGYGSLVKFDHDFTGRQALERMAAAPHRAKVTLLWNGDDVARAFGSLFTDGDTPAKFIDLPLANYATLPFDLVRRNGTPAGLSTYTGYSVNERAMLSLGIVEAAHSAPGTEVTIVWGERDGGSSKPTVEPHRQVEIRATVAPAPISETARLAYRPRR